MQPPRPHTHAGAALRQLKKHISTNDLHCCRDGSADFVRTAGRTCLRHFNVLDCKGCASSIGKRSELPVFGDDPSLPLPVRRHMNTTPDHWPCTNSEVPLFRLLSAAQYFGHRVLGPVVQVSLQARRPASNCQRNESGQWAHHVHSALVEFCEGQSAADPGQRGTWTNPIPRPRSCR